MQSVVDHVSLREKPTLDWHQYSLASATDTSPSSHNIKSQLVKERKGCSVDVAAVLSQMATGGGLARLNSTLPFLDVPRMQKRMYSATDQFLGGVMKEQFLGRSRLLRPWHKL